MKDIDSNANEADAQANMGREEAAGNLNADPEPEDEGDEREPDGTDGTDGGGI